MNETNFQIIDPNQKFLIKKLKMEQMKMVMKIPQIQVFFIKNALLRFFLLFENIKQSESSQKKKKGKSSGGGGHSHQDQEVYVEFLHVVEKNDKIKRKRFFVNHKWDKTQKKRQIF